MINTMTIGFDGIGGITPLGSTYADVLQLWGNLFQVEYQPEYILMSGRAIKAKTLLHFKALKTLVVFDTDEPLRPDMPVRVVGAETGCRLRSPDGLWVGLSKAKARAIASWCYRVNLEASRDYVIYMEPRDGHVNTELGVYFENDQVEFIGVYRK